MNLRARILLYVVAVMAIVFVMVIATILPDTLNESKNRIAAAREATTVFKILLENLPAQRRAELGKNNRKFFENSGVLDAWLLTDLQGKVVLSSTPGTPKHVAPAEYIAAQRFDQMETVFTPESERLILYARTNMRASSQPLDVWGIFVVMAVGTLLLAFVIYGLMLRLVVTPVERLAAASRMGASTKGILAPVASTDRQDEIGELVRAYNKMVGEVNDLRLNLEKRVSDATRELQAAQNQIVLSERLSVAGRMAAGVAHEINNPLGGMLNAARALKGKAQAGTREAEYLELILEGLSRVQTIVASMLQFSRPAQQPSPVDLAEVLEGALLFCRHRFAKLELKLEKNYAPDAAHTVLGHRSELGQVFLNLLVNALDAMEAKGTGPHTLSLKLERSGELVTATVSDTGQGMPPEVKERAGQFFYSTKAEGKGTGLGLAVVQHIVLQHKGTVRIDSSEGQGTTVVVELPAYAETPAAKSVA
ncbi:MAG TPA: HAMP domain-containing sensor histidine kinase [Planctomycetota bacterium]|nr:HAMP domain-containing sensor histidine kinase [Planctomycetota bacterium]